MVRARFQRWVGTAGLLLATVAAAQAQPAGPASATPALTEAAAVRGLDRWAAERQHPVRLRGVITYSDPAWSNWFLQDATDGIFIYRTNATPPLDYGQEVDLEGVTIPGGFAPVVALTRVTIRGRAELPAARPASFEELASGRLDSQRVETEAIVRAAYIHEGHLRLELGAARPFPAFIAGPAIGSPPLHLVDARVRVRGVWGTQFNSRGQMAGYKIFVQSLDDVAVIEPPPAGLETLELRPVAEALRFPHTRAFGRRMRLAGVVTAQSAPGEFFLQDQTAGMRATTRDPVALSPGDRVEVAGFVELGAASPALVEATIVRREAGQAPAPLAIDLAGGLKPAWDARLVRFEATVVDHLQKPAAAALVVRAGSEVVTAWLHGTNAADSLRAIGDASRIAVTGVAELSVDENQRGTGMEILLRGPADVAVLARPPWWNTPRALALGAVVAAALIGWRYFGLRREGNLAERYRRVVENARDLISVHGADGRFVSANPAWQRAAGHSPQKLRTMRLSDLLAPGQELSYDAWWRKVQGEESTVPKEFELRTADGTRRVWIELSTRPLTADPRLPLIESIGRDVTDRKKAESILRASEALLERTEQIAGVGGWELDLASQSLRWSQQLRRIHEVSADYRPDPDQAKAFFPAEERKSFERALSEAIERGTSFDLELPLVTARGRSIWVRVMGEARTEAGRVVQLWGAYQDITLRKELEQQANRTQRLQGIGSLAGGIAHDLNNALAPVLLSLDHLRHFPEDNAGLLELASTSTTRAAAMVRQLLAFARGTEGRKTSLRPAWVLSEIETLLHSTFPKNIRVQKRLGTQLGSVEGDATELHQVLLNLCLNARDAMPEGGTIILEADLEEVGPVPEGVCEKGEFRPGRHAVFRVTDTGLGMPRATLDRIFEPFFSTKSASGGTGLGLSTALGIARAHGGFLRVRSGVGEGSEFSFYLPLARDPAQPGLPETDGAGVFVEPRGQGEFVLFVDDEHAVCEMVRVILGSLNFRPLIAGGGVDGLRLATEYAGEVKVVITDLHMPGLDGLGLIRALRSSGSKVPVVVASGRIEPAQWAELQRLGVHLTLDKPFARSTLMRILQQALHVAVTPRV